MRYRKKPVEVEAVQLRWDTWNEMCDFVGVGPGDDQPHGTWVDGAGKPIAERTSDAARIGLLIPTPEGVMLAIECDWVIRGVQGEFYPCKPEIFDATYEAVK